MNAADDAVMLTGLTGLSLDAATILLEAARGDISLAASLHFEAEPGALAQGAARTPVVLAVSEDDDDRDEDDDELTQRARARRLLRPRRRGRLILGRRHIRAHQPTSALSLRSPKGAQGARQGARRLRRRLRRGRGCGRWRRRLRHARSHRRGRRGIGPRQWRSSRDDASRAQGEEGGPLGADPRAAPAHRARRRRLRL